MEVRAEVEAVLRGLDDAGCNWCPDEDEPSVAVLVLDLLGHAPPPGPAPLVRSRRELLALVAERAERAPVAPDARSARRVLDLHRTARRYREARAQAAGLRPSGAGP